MITTYTGSCHCGRIKVEFMIGRDPRSLVPRACRCGFCQRHRSLAISDPEGRMVLQLPVDPLQPYRFGLDITDFYICDRCGVWVAATWHDEDRQFGVVNIPALDERMLFDAAPVKVDVDGENIATRAERRRTAWTPATIVAVG